MIDLWDNNPLDACCLVPTGYHPSNYGSYLNALVLFDEITGVDPRTLGGVNNPSLRNDAIFSRHHWRVSAVAPHASSGSNR